MASSMLPSSWSTKPASAPRIRGSPLGWKVSGPWWTARLMPWKAAGSTTCPARWTWPRSPWAAPWATSISATARAGGGRAVQGSRPGLKPSFPARPCRPPRQGVSAPSLRCVAGIAVSMPQDSCSAYWSAETATPRKIRPTLSAHAPEFRWTKLLAWLKARPTG